MLFAVCRLWCAAACCSLFGGGGYKWLCDGWCVLMVVGCLDLLAVVCCMLVDMCCVALCSSFVAGGRLLSVACLSLLVGCCVLSVAWCFVRAVCCLALCAGCRVMFAVGAMLCGL